MNEFREINNFRHAQKEIEEVNAKRLEVRKQQMESEVDEIN